MDRCWAGRYPWPHSEEQSGWYYEKCTTQCRAQFAECDKEQEEALKARERKLTFSSIRQAIDWINGHKGEVTLGTVIIVGGTAFALGINPFGWLVLIPIAATAA